MCSAPLTSFLSPRFLFLNPFAFLCFIDPWPFPFQKNPSRVMEYAREECLAANRCLGPPLFLFSLLPNERAAVGRETPETIGVGRTVKQ